MAILYQSLVDSLANSLYLTLDLQNVGFAYHNPELRKYLMTLSLEHVLNITADDGRWHKLTDSLVG